MTDMIESSSNNTISNVKILDQSGQSIIEFVLLMSSIVIISFTFMRLMNTNIADKWQELAQVILEDDSQTLTLK